MTRPQPQGTRREQGMILLVVLWTVSILTVIAVALTTYVQRNLVTAATENLQLRSEMVLRGGLHFAGALVLAAKEDDRLFMDRVERDIDLGGGRRIAVSATDASASIDLNKTEKNFMEAVFIAILESKGAGKEMAEAVGTIRKLGASQDKGAKPGGDGNAGRQTIGETSKPQRPPSSLANANNPAKDKPEIPDDMPVFVSPLQLLTLPGMEPEQVNRIIPFAGVVSREGKINPMTAPPVLLAAIPKIKDGQLDVIREARVRKNIKSEEFKALMKEFSAFLTIDPPRVYRVSVEIKEGPGVIAGSRLFATILLTPDAPKPFQVLSLSW